MRTLVAAAAALLAVYFASAPASATVYFGNFGPSDTVAVAHGGFQPVDTRSPDADNSWSSSADTYAAYSYGAGYYQNLVTTFTIDSSFTAAHLIVPLSFAGGYGDRRVGFNIQHLIGGSWVGEGFGQVNASALPANGSIVEVDIPFGNVVGSSFIGMPIAFVSGDSYRIATNHAAGGIGDMFWYFADDLAAADQTFSVDSRYAGMAFAHQLAFALTDGGTLGGDPTDVPEPAMVGLFGLAAIGTGLARRRRGERSCR